MFLWKPFCRTIHRYGLGLAAVIAVMLFFSISCETRQNITAIPFFVVFTVKVIDSLNWKASEHVLIGTCSFLYSKVWMTINGEVAPRYLQETHMSFPEQYFNMSFGPLMSPQMYAVQGGIVLLTAMFFHFQFFHGKKITG